jgi:hypothetical protein
VNLNTRSDTATLINSDDEPVHLSAPWQGNGQTLRDGNLVVGWARCPT